MPVSNKSTRVKKEVLDPHTQKGLHHHHKKNGPGFPDYSKNHTGVSLSDSTTSGCPTKYPPQGGCTGNTCSNLKGVIPILLGVVGVGMEVGGIAFRTVVPLISAIFTAFYPSQTDNSKLISDLVTYVDEKIEEEISNEIVETIEGHWGDILDYSQSLLEYIENNASASFRQEKLDNILYTCDLIREKLGEYSLSAPDAVSLIGPIGTQCLTWFHAQAYNYTEITGDETIHASTVIELKEKLDERISQFYSLSSITSLNANTWRYNFGLGVGMTWWEPGYTIANVCSCDKYEVALIADNACPGIGGPPADSYQHQVGYGDTAGCCLEIKFHTQYPPSEAYYEYSDLEVNTRVLDAAVQYYSLMVNHSFADQFVSPFSDNFSLLWGYLNSSNFEAGVKPTLKTRVAASPPRHQNIMNLVTGQDDKICAVKTTEWDVMERLGLMGYDSFQASTITEISVKLVSAGIHAVKYVRDSDYDIVGHYWDSRVWHTFSIPGNMVITAISGVKKGSTSFGVKTTYVEKNGAHVKNGTLHDGIKWVIGTESDIDWIEAPLVTQSNNTFVSYVPHIIGIVG